MKLRGIHIEQRGATLLLDLLLQLYGIRVFPGRMGQPIADRNWMNVCAREEVDILKLYIHAVCFKKGRTIYTPLRGILPMCYDQICVPRRHG